jgi:FkbM family methyltransferase
MNSDQTPHPVSRAFGLRAPSIDPELESLLNFARWLGDDIDAAVLLSSITGPQIRQHFPAGEPATGVIACASGLDLAADMSDIFAASAAFGRMQEAEDFEAFMDMVDPGAVVIDVGANFGVYATHAALHAGAAGRVFAFEPLPAAFDLLAANIAANRLAATPVRAAVAAEAGSARFRMAADSSFSGLRDTGRSTTLGEVEVEVVNLDGFAPLAGLAASLVKIDVEGGEHGVLRGARDLLGRSPDVVVMFEFSYKNLDETARAALVAELDALAGLGLELHCRSGAGLARIAPSDLVGQRSENLFLVRPQSPAADRLARAIGKPQPAPTPDQAAAIALLKRYAVLWRERQSR